jgi:Toprim domain
VTAAEIAAALGGRRAQRLADGSYLVPCPLPSHGKGRGDRNPSLHISDDQTRLLVYCNAGCDSRDVLDELRRRGLLGSLPLDNGPSKRTPPPAIKGSSDYEHQQHDKARWLWAQRRPIAGTIAEKYLRGRKITCALPATLGFLPARKPEHHPALIAAFALPDEPEPGVVGTPHDVESVHLTLLKPDGSGKAEIVKPKLMIGSPASRPIVLAPPNDLMGLAITEGLEDALTAHQMTGLGAWAAGAAGFLPKLATAVPSSIEAVTMFAHADKAGQDGAHELAQGLRHNGIDVVIEGLPA